MERKILLFALMCFVAVAVLDTQCIAFLEGRFPERLMRIDSENEWNNNDFSLEIYEEKGVIINASDYSGENDTERLQAAFDDVPPEGAVVLISGLWTAAGLIAKSNTTVLGMNGTIQRPDDTTAPFITFENRSNFAIVNLTFDGRGINDSFGIKVINGNSFVVQNNSFVSVKRNAVKVSLSLEGLSENFTIADNLLIDCENAPVLVFGNPTKRAIRDFIIFNNTILNGTVNGKIGVAFSAEGLIVNNTVANSQYGIATRCVSNITIKGNSIRNNKDYGVYLGTQISGNGTANLLVEQNSIVSNYIGIARYYGSYPITDVVIKNNQFINNSLYDILADFPATYIDNVITSAEKLAIQDVEAVFIETRTITNDLILPGDINFDLKIDIRDVAFVAKRYGCHEGATGWDLRADIIRDGAIDIKDVAYVSRNFGLIA